MGSTIVQLLERFYDPTAMEEEVYEEVDGEFKISFAGSDVELGSKKLDTTGNSGEVQLDGTDLRSLDVRWVRNNIGLVGQEPVLFNDTVYNNIALGKEVVRGKRLKLLRRVPMPMTLSWNYPINSRPTFGVMGSKVSGGQKQRIAIARALVK